MTWIDFMWSELMWNRVTTIAMSVVIIICLVFGGIYLYHKFKKTIKNGAVAEAGFSKVNQVIHADIFSFNPSILLNADGKIIGANKRTQKLFGWREEDLRGKGIDEIITEDCINKFETHKRERSASVNDEEVYPIELDAITRLGDKRNLEVIIGRWSDDLDWYFTITMRDITHRKRNEEAVRAAEKEINYLREIYHEGEKIGNVAFWKLDCRTGKMQFSPNFANMYAIKGTDITVESLIKRVVADDKLRVVQAMNTAKENKTGYEVEYRFIGLDGYINTMYSTVSAIKDKKGDLTHFIGMARLLKKEKPTWL